MADGCLFCKIVAGEIPAKCCYEDEHILAFEDKFPKAPTHWLVIPRKHIASLNDLVEEDAKLIAHLTLQLKVIAQKAGLKGYRTIVNTGPEGGQEIFHLHYHILGGPGRLPGF